MGEEGEFQPGSRNRVLKNSREITGKAEMDELEVQLLAAAKQRALNTIQSDTQFTTKLLLQLHFDWLGEIYPWAGRYRTVEMSKEGFHWPPASRVAANMERFEAKILKPNTPFTPTSLEIGLPILAEIHAELLLIHPFREGNGRMARWLNDLLCLQAGWQEPDYGFVGRGSRANQKSYLDAVITGYDCNYQPLVTFFRDALDRSTNR